MKHLVCHCGHTWYYYTCIHRSSCSCVRWWWVVVGCMWFVALGSRQIVLIYYMLRYFCIKRKPSCCQYRHVDMLLNPPPWTHAAPCGIKYDVCSSSSSALNCGSLTLCSITYNTSDGRLHCITMIIALEGFLLKLYLFHIQQELVSPPANRVLEPPDLVCPLFTVPMTSLWQHVLL